MNQLRSELKPQTEVHTSDLRPTVDEEHCVCPEAHAELDRQISAVAPNPLMKFIVMGEVLAAPRCRRPGGRR